MHQKDLNMHCCYIFPEAIENSPDEEWRIYVIIYLAGHLSRMQELYRKGITYDEFSRIF